MGSPIFARSDVFGEKANASGRAPAGAQGQQAQYGQQQYGAGYAATDAATLNTMYSSPSATTADTGRLTYDDVIVKTGGLLALLVAVGAVSWVMLPPAFTFIGAIVGLVLGLVNAFKREPSPALIVAYTAAQGVFLGGISKVFEAQWSGIVLQAVLATVCTFAACLWLFRSGRVRVTPRFTRWLLFAMVGYLVFSLVNVVMMFAGVGDGGFGPLREGPLGIAVGLIAVGLASASLIVDFDAIQRGVRNGVPKKYAWSAAFGLMVTLIWLYLEFLRLLAILRGE
ncbi:Bax inhibitor-1/YccA family protein [Sanguibacter sp. 4.1]|uniref:Bax inhibitor-1/YccA family protein n=1 Tax=Sanguibacter biliveldensis TaxID=3030830 RepID=A0AAF0Z958_9MICO|nr:Bax inhibitor-1/YccA family protein [Sanguibacter sp. 4.1]WPF83144.1 Bax inhibitor-1/YccA family protein [Sanguibacter sp. 4.1]